MLLYISKHSMRLVLSILYTALTAMPGVEGAFAGMPSTRSIHQAFSCRASPSDTSPIKPPFSICNSSFICQSDGSLVTTNTLQKPTAANAANTTRLIPILVGGSTLTFTPNSVIAQPGDVLQFQFGARNHTVTQSAQLSPCQPLASNGSSGINSGFIPFDGGTSGAVGTFDVPVTNDQPMWLYCAQATHCQAGMVMSVNA